MRARWEAAWRSLGVAPPAGLFEALRDRYGEPQRAYHTWDHVRACLDEVEAGAGPVASRPEVVLALFFHDAVYDPMRGDNEAQSAAWAASTLVDAGRPDSAARVSALVMATAHGGGEPAPADPDIDLMLDADLSILGQPDDVYDAFETAIRAEFRAVPDAAFRAGRGRVLRRFIEQPRIYRTPHFHERYEAAARANLGRALAALAAGPGVSADDGHVVLRYMDRFRCIGPECEDDCCHGWRVDVDAVTHKKLLTVSALTSREAGDRLRSALRTAGRKTRKTRARFEIKLASSGRCPLQEPTGLCFVQDTFGSELLPNVCAQYPRKLQRVGARVELTGMCSCPEVTRQLLLHEDALDEVPLDLATLDRRALNDAIDVRDVRPWWRQWTAVRAVMRGVLERHDLPLEQRLCLMAWFAKRTAATLATSPEALDHAAVQAELALLEDPRVLDELRSRFAALETPASLVLLLTRSLVRPPPGRGRVNFRALAERVLEAVGVASEGEGPTGAATSARVWARYRERRRVVMEWGGAQVERYLTHVAINWWGQRLPVESPDVMVHLLRMLTEIAVMKLLIFAHPDLGEVPEADPYAPVLERVAVEVVYKTARFVEHSGMLRTLEATLAGRQLASMAGAVYLARF